MSDKPINTDAKDVNILFIGETGVGKSTCINAIATYLIHNTFKKASTSTIINLIPTDFTFEQDDDGDDFIIKLDDDDEIQKKINSHSFVIDENESTEVGRSRTLKPKSHDLKHEDRTVRIIDTPGINDTDDKTQVKKNMQEIVDYISDLTHLNLIVFLMPPNQSRFTPAFEFCFKELIMQFHRSAAENIVFAFTKSADCGYQVHRITQNVFGYKLSYLFYFYTGETFAQLEHLLEDIKAKQGIDLPFNKKKTTYSFENKSYPELCNLQLKGKKVYKNDKLSTMETDYGLSRNEHLRLIEHALEVSPTHDHQKTVLVHELEATNDAGILLNDDFEVTRVPTKGRFAGKFLVGDVITHINDNPVFVLKQWEGALAKGGRLRFSVNRKKLPQRLWKLNKLATLEIFTSTTHDNVHEYICWNAGKFYYCKECFEKTDRRDVIAWLIKGENGEDYVVLGKKTHAHVFEDVKKFE